jgi:hypothetical protein
MPEIRVRLFVSDTHLLVVEPSWDFEILFSFTFFKLGCKLTDSQYFLQFLQFSFKNLKGANETN